MSKRQISSCLLNASVILAGLKSPSGGSGKILSWVKQARIKGVISEIILDEVLRNSQKIGLSEEQTSQIIEKKSIQIIREPKEKSAEKFKKIVINVGDTHVLASSQEQKVDFLVTLDQKHLLALKDKVKIFKIVTPGQLIERLSNT